MSKKSIISALVYIIVALAGVCHGQLSTLVFDLFDEHHGLPNNSSSDVFQDRDGIIWIGSFDGLSRFDGRSVTTFRSNLKDTSSISGNRISTIFEDNQSRLWVGTGLTGLNVSNTSKTKFKSIAIINGDTLVRSTVIHEICQDVHGNIWVAGDKGLDIIKLIGDEFFHVAISDFLPDSSSQKIVLRVTCLTTDRDSNIWIGTSSGICKFNSLNKEFTSPVNNVAYPSNFIDDLEIDRKGRLWISCKSRQARLFMLDQAQNQFIPFSGIPFKSARRRLHFTFDLDNRIWAAPFGEQLYAYDFYDSTLILESNLNSNITLERFIRRPFCDNSGMIWIPTGGLYQYPYPLGFNTYIHSYNFFQASTTIFADSNFSWHSYRESGIVRYDKKNNDHQLYSISEPPPYKLPTNHIQDIIKSASGNVIVAGFNHIIVWHARTDKITSFRVGGSSRDLFQDSKGRLWLGSLSGLIEFDETTGVKRKYSLPKLKGDSRNFVQAIAEDMDGHIWFGSGLKGLGKLNPETGQFQHFLPDPSIPNSLPSYTIIDMASGRDKFIWLAMNVALVRLDPTTSEFTIFDKSNGLQSEYISSVICTNDNQIWVSTQAGIAKFDQATETFKCYGSEYGLLNSIYYMRNKFYDSDGYIYFGGTNGIDYFHPDLLREYPFDPGVRLTDFTVDGESVTIDASTVPSFTYKQDLIEITVAGNNYSNQQKTTYEYKLLGLGDQWIQVGSQDHFIFSNLPGGEYIFEARAISQFGQKRSNELLIPFKVLPPFWNTWWFRSLILLIILIAVILFMKYRESQIEKNARIQTQMHKRIQEVEKKALLAQMNPHFIFNSMNSIQQFMALGDFEGAMKYLTKFARLLRFVLNFSSESHISLADELALITDYIELEKMRFPNSFTYSINVSEDIEVHAIEIPPFFIQPQIENAIRHGLPNKEGPRELKIDINRINGDLKIIVEDNGIGRDAAKKYNIRPSGKDKSMGLSLVEERLKYIQGGASEYKLKITDLKDSNDIPLGTRVEILLPI